MDISQHPDFADTLTAVERSFGADWARRFVLTAPLMIGDRTSPLYRAFLDGLAAHTKGDPAGEDAAWARCESLMADLAVSLVAEAEALLSNA